MKILVVDNYDSFTYNLVQYIGEVDEEPKVVRNDEWNLDDIREYQPEAIIISPGPGMPKDAGISNEVIQYFGDEIPILGVCLGHQCIAEVFGGKIIRAERLLHGKTSSIYHDNAPVYRNLPSPFTATRYHSLIVDENNFPEELSIDSVSENDEIMGLHHVEKPIVGVQFHPESILTDHGRTLMRNFLDYAENPEPIGKNPRPKLVSGKR